MVLLYLVGKKSAMPEIDGSFALSEMEAKVFGLVLDFWPVCALDIAHHCNEKISSREEKKKASTKYSYYLRKLVGKKLVLGRRVGNALVVWPLVVEKYRVIHDILS